MARGIKQEIETFRKDRIRIEAEKLFYERGFSGTSMDAIAESMRATKPFIYGSYASKADILFDIHLHVVDTVVEATEWAAKLPGSATENLRAFAIRLTDLVLRNREAVAVFFREEWSLSNQQIRKINDHKGEIDAGILALLQRGVDTGEFRVDDPRIAALAIGGMISWCYVWYRPDGRLGADQVGEHMATYALRVAGARDL